ncbi:TonB-dependent receptor domain-containing protein [Marinifilum flexuosum]|uniref:Outer membrane receptor protein involved in Fe transport n=1 Tax=Marinifilum flexuosum TaxID=1117708 RepID=A0A419X318_9BACT|nr:outer membrane beta-barrel family protein [Marinifilum flexuosum]RKE02093.1 outer membrane receptor protein involved in Fe transport [Marinifilum flexuosum]
MNRLLLLLSFVCLAMFSKAVEPAVKPEIQGGIIKGVVKDQALEIPVEYATVSVYSMADSTLIDGTITDAKGAFSLKKLKPGSYFVEVSFIGYNKAAVRNIPISKKRKVIDLKTVSLRQSTESLDEVTVTTERIPVQYQIDKKVIPVSRQITAASGNAVDVLENVPSVSVDIEGNVSLRGSSNFTVLVDGKPSILDAADILEQMPASMIENIEIITNPSAKYDPEGTAGIINVITKKNKSNGIAGVANLNLGTQNNYGGDVLLTYRKKKLNLNFGIDYGKRGFKGSTESVRRNTLNGITNHILSDGDTQRDRLSYGIRTGFDYDINEKNQVSFGFRLGNREMERKSILDYEEFVEGEDSEFYDSKDFWSRDMSFINSNLSYTKKFKGKGHQWANQITFSRRGSGDEISTNELKSGTELKSGQISTEEGPGERWEFRSDYTLPLGEDSKFEIGYQGQVRSSDAITMQENYNPDNGLYELINNHDVTYKRRVHGVYSTYASKVGKFGYQLGFRTEYTDREITFDNNPDKFTIKRWDFFPTIHTQFDLGSKNQIMASYTRRIQRPRGWYLEPFRTNTDAFNARLGNPDLKPEYIDSYELGYMKRFGDQAISFEVYHKRTDNKLERVKALDKDGIMVSTPENVGKDYSTGLEATLNLSFAKWFKNDLIGTVYYYKEEGDFTTENTQGEMVIQDFSTDSYNWSLRNNMTFIINPKTRFQLNVNYRSPTDWAQGKREGFVMATAAIKRDFFKRKLSATLTMRDLFGTFKHESEVFGPDFYTSSQFKMDYPSFRFNLSYKINNYKKKRGSRGSNGGVDTEDFEM